MDGCHAFERAEACDPAAVDLGEGLGGSDSNASAVVASGAGSYDDSGEIFARGDLGEDLLKRGEEVAFLGSLAGEILAGRDLAISTEREGGVSDAGFDGEDPFVWHALVWTDSSCSQTKKSSRPLLETLAWLRGANYS